MNTEEFIIKANKAYRKGKPIISDEEYDKLIDSLPKHHPLKDKVGYAFGRTEALPVKLGSLNKVKTIAEVCKWEEGYNSSLIHMPKLDGLTLMLHYKDGYLINAWTRGDGEKGTKVLAHAKLINFVPYEIDTITEMYIVGECIMSYESFFKYKDQYKNPRNLACGIISKEEVDLRCKDLDFIAFRCHTINSTYSTLSEELRDLQSLGFESVEYSLEGDLNNMLDAMKLSLPGDYDCDGIVIAINDISQHNGEESNGLNPKWARAYKPQNNNGVSTEIVDINWQVSRLGILTPVIEIKPIYTSGVTITHVSGHNLKNIKDNHLGVGAEIKVVRSGDVIPYITEVVKPVGATIPHTCKYCGSMLIETEVELKHSSFDCSEINLKRVEHFLSTLNIENLKYSSLKKIKDISIEKILEMGLDDFKLYFSEQTALKHFNEIRSKIKDVDRAKLMDSLGIFDNLGEKSLREIITNVDLNIPLFPQIIELKGFGHKSARTFSNLYPSYLNTEHELLVRGLTYINPKKKDESKGSFVMSGFRDKDLAAKLEAQGYKQGSSISKNTKLLIVKDVNSTSSKIKKARELGINIIGVDEVK